MKKKSFYIIWILIAAAVIGLGAGIVTNWVQDITHETASSAVFTSTVEDQGGVDVSSAFKIVFDKEISSASVGKFLSVEPHIDMGFHQGSSKREVLIAPAEPLTAGTVYKFTLDTLEDKEVSWAIQTKSPLSISKTYPADRAVNIPTDAHISIELDQVLAVDMAQLEEYITIEPAVSGTWQQQGKTLRFIPERRLTAATVYKVSVTAGLPLRGSNVSLAQGIEFVFETYDEAFDSWSVIGEYAYTPNTAPDFRISGIDGIMEAQLYSFAASGDYGDIWQEMITAYPGWSNGCKYIRDVVTDNARLYSSYSVTINDGVFELPEALPQGYYLLRCQAQNDTRDVLFCVSHIDYWVEHDGKNALFWFHDSSNKAPLTVNIATPYVDTVTVTSSPGGAAWILGQTETAKDMVYAVSRLSAEAGQELIIPVFARSIGEYENYANMRYLYTDQCSYKAGEILDFWGMVKPKDGSAMEYERVSVYIYSYSLSDVVYRDYAPIKDSIFSGSITLPTLLEGNYCLQIWQSGKLLVDRDFVIGEKPAKIEKADNTGESYITLNKSSYAAGDSILAQCEAAADDYLFFGSEQGIITFATGIPEMSLSSSRYVPDERTAASYMGTFDPIYKLGNYLTCLRYIDGEYIAGAPEILRLDSSSSMLDIAVTTDSLEQLSASHGSAEITITDINDLPVTGASVAVNIICSEEEPRQDTFADIFGDIPPYFAQMPVEQNIYAPRGDSLVFAVLTTDEEGVCRFEYDLPAFKGQCWLTVQSIDGKNMSCGSTTMLLSNGDGSGMQTDDITATNSHLSGYQLADLTESTVLHDDNIVTIFGSYRRMQTLSMLMDIAFTPDFGTNAEAAVAYAHARQLLLDYGGEVMTSVVSPGVDIGIYQKADGGLGALEGDSDLQTSATAIAAAPNNIDYAALRGYFENSLNSGSRQSVIMALAGLALYNQPVLNEVRYMLSMEDLTDEEYLWLLWAEYACGNIQPVGNSFYDWENSIDRNSVSADTAALAAVLSALTGHGEPWAHLDTCADMAGTEACRLETVLAVRSLLPSLYQETSSFMFTVGDNTVPAQMSGISDYLLPAGENEVQFSNISGNVWYIDVYRIH